MPTVADALAAIRTRALAAGHNPTDTQVLATYNRDVARGDTLAQIIGQAGGGSTTNTPAQAMTPTSAGPAGSSIQGASISSGLGNVSPNVLLIGGAALLLLIVLRKK
jgi:hypothetical protein